MSENSGKKTVYEVIEEGHRLREELLYKIQIADRTNLEYYKGQFSRLINDDSLKILKRIPQDPLRAYKNILLSHNTLYSYSAEKGGLSAAQSHFMSEKYAIMIEHTNDISQLEKIHMDMLDEYIDPSNRMKKHSNSTVLDQAINFINMNFAEDLTVNEIAEKVHVHPAHLMRLFKQEKGMTISHFRNQKRIKEAKELLVHTKLSITNISTIVGYNNPQYFSEVFKQHEGMTPKEFRGKFKWGS